MPPGQCARPGSWAPGKLGVKQGELAWRRPSEMVGAFTGVPAEGPGTACSLVARVVGL